jgi:hypothetical protein
MKDASETVSESIKYLGQGFLLAYYLPALVFVLTHLYIVIPTSIEELNLSQGASKKLVLPLLGEINFASLIDTLLWSFIIGIVLLVLNSVLIRAFEGKPLWLQKGLLYYLTKRNRKYHKILYGKLVRLKRQYLYINTRMDRTASPNDLLRLSEKLEKKRLEINQEHKKIEKRQSSLILPLDIRRVCPTSFGNAYAIAEEYPYERYGADSVLFWPHLRALMHEKAPSHSLRLTQQKTILDLSINFAFLAGLLTVETILILVFSGYKHLLLILTGATFIFAISFYQASVVAIQGMGELIKVSFDYHRGLVLQAFNLRMPDNLSEEQTVWVKLATFIRRGDAFYFPEEYRDHGMGSGGIEEKKKDD